VGPRAVLDAVVKRKISSPRRESNPRTPIVQLVAQRYTDWAKIIKARKHRDLQWHDALAKIHKSWFLEGVNISKHAWTCRHQADTSHIAVTALCLISYAIILKFEDEWRKVRHLNYSVVEQNNRWVVSINYDSQDMVWQLWYGKQKMTIVTNDSLAPVQKYQSNSHLTVKTDTGPCAGIAPAVWI
jgi:hypothetical protein